ncbi:hypothetical protein [Sulfuriroseicoccus oceanibius]|uniref:Uncharacterized protein n=1 Tax=Sulfuriroseicoccus oceanibius TaxID=2707525 RepID=A0A6B3L074_9BACT|nr:hypothetical protein [Sulfuriroseicoccus oceanibius]QQL43755.1 hypothetical protein G3M56_007530 [Sulfuriroseicoccus oceanibius]
MNTTDRMRTSAQSNSRPSHSTTPTPAADSRQLGFSLRIDEANPTHHLWNNNGTWWCNFTVHDGCHRTQRVRFSLKTKDVATAIIKRDQLLQRLS